MTIAQRIEQAVLKNCGKECPYGETIAELFNTEVPDVFSQVLRTGIDARIILFHMLVDAYYAGYTAKWEDDAVKELEALNKL